MKQTGSRGLEAPKERAWLVSNDFWHIASVYPIASIRWPADRQDDLRPAHQSVQHGVSHASVGCPGRPPQPAGALASETRHLR
jgi:hypothetical protein